jgi:spore germination cell wall hydrolase CwlJ-like protein
VDVAVRVAVIAAALAVGHCTGQRQRAEAPVPVPEVRVEVDVWAGLNTPAVIRHNPRWEEARVCLALNAYHEARGESFDGQVAVGQVALRRAGLDYRHVCGEIYRPGQFSWTSDRPRGSHLPSDPAWSWAVAAGDAALRWATTGEGADHSQGATFYHARSVTPYWTRGLERVAVIDQHLFYR